MKEEALDCTQWRIRFGRISGPVIRQTTECISYGLKTALLTFLRELETYRGESNPDLTKHDMTRRMSLIGSLTHVTR